MGTPDQCATPVLCHTAHSGLGTGRSGDIMGVTSPEKAVLIFEEESLKVENKRGKQ